MGTFARQQMTPFATLRKVWRRPERVRSASLRVLDFALLGVLLIAPLAIGGRQDHGRLIYVVFATTAGVAAALANLTATRRASLGTRLPLLLFAIGAFVLLTQITPLPTPLLSQLAPSHADTLPMWTGEPETFGQWSLVSLTPHRTLRDLALWLAHGCLFYAALVRMRSGEDVRTLLMKLAGASVLAGVLGVASQAIANGKLLGVYDYPAVEFGEHLQGTFTNRNHFGGFLLLGVWSLPLVALSVNSPRAKLAVNGVMVTLVVLILATMSRGAAAAFGVSLLVAMAVWWRSGRARRQHALASAIAVLCVLGGLSFFGYEQIAKRLDDLVTADVEQLDRIAGRRAIWQANIDAFVSSPYLGYGAGSQREAHKRFLEKPFATEFTHAESSFLQVASETGLAGLLVVGAGIALVVIWVTRGVAACTDDTSGATMVAIAAPLAGTTIHATIDFVWHAPVICAGALLLAAAACRQATLSACSPECERAPYAGWAAPFLTASVAVFACVTLAGPAVGAYHWDAYLRTSRTLRDLTAELSKPSEQPSDPHLPEMIRRLTAKSVEQLERVVASDPNHGRAWSRLASRLDQHYSLGADEQTNPMPCLSLRDAAFASEFPSSQATIAWLDRAVGESSALIKRRHEAALRAVRCSPLDGDAYLSLASTAMLFDTPRPQVDKLADQALAVKPYDGRVLFEAGRQLRSIGAVDRTLELWREAAARPGSHRFLLVSMVASALPAEDFVREIKPSSDLLLVALPIYEQRSGPADISLLAKQAFENATAAHEAEPLLEQASRWQIASTLARHAGRSDLAMAASEWAMRLEPHHFDIRHERAVVLREAGKHAEADPHLRWCLARRPDLPHLQRWLEDGAKLQTVVEQNRQERYRRAIAHRDEVMSRLDASTSGAEVR